MKGGDMIDGGLIANHPGLMAYYEVEHFLKCNMDSVKMLHIGTLSAGKTTSGRFTNSAYIFQWFFGRDPMELSISAQERATNFMLKFTLKDRLYTIDEVPAKEKANSFALDKANKRAQLLLLQTANSSFQKHARELERQGFISRKGEDQ